MIVSLLATLLFCGCIISLFGAIFFLSKKVGVPDASSRHKYVTRGSLIASERFTDLMSKDRNKRYLRNPWD